MRVIHLLATSLLLGGCAPPEPVAVQTPAAAPRTATPAPAAHITSEADATPTPRTRPNPPSTAATDTAHHIVRDDAGEPGLALPPSIIRALQTDEQVLTCPDGTRDGASRFTPDWIAVRRLDLNADGRPDWIVNGRHACLRTSYATHWWVYADDEGGPGVVLRAEPAAAIEILGTSTNGFRDLRTHLVNGRGAALIADNRYDGERYQAAPAP